MSRRVGLAAGLALVTAVVAGSCSTTESGSGAAGTRASSAAASGSSTPSKAGASGGSGTFPRTPYTTAIGDPATADVCAAVPLRSFAALHGYTAVHDGEVLPPGCTVRIMRGRTPAFTVLAYGVGPNSFSHLGPPHVSKVVRTSKIDGVGVNYYAFAAEPIGDCARDVLGDGVTFKVDVLGSSDDGNSARIRTLHCAAADAMTRDLAAAVASDHFPRLRLPSTSLTRIDFCDVLGATKLDDLADFAGALSKADGLGDGCALTRGSSLALYVDFEVEPAAVPQLTKASVVDGHHLYADTGNDQSSSCRFTSVQERMPDGRYEAVSLSADYTASGGSRSPTQLCTESASVITRFLTTAGLS